MRKTLGMIFAVAVLGALLAGCYSKTCDSAQPTTYHSLKGEG